MTARSSASRRGMSLLVGVRVGVGVRGGVGVRVGVRVEARVRVRVRVGVRVRLEAGCDALLDDDGEGAVVDQPRPEVMRA